MITSTVPKSRLGTAVHGIAGALRRVLPFLLHPRVVAGAGGLVVAHILRSDPAKAERVAAAVETGVAAVVAAVKGDAVPEPLAPVDLADPLAAEPSL